MSAANIESGAKEFSSLPFVVGLLFFAGLFVGGYIPILIFGHWLSEEGMESQENLVRIYNEVALGEDDTSVAEKVIANVTMESVYAPIGKADAVWDVTSPAIGLLSGEWMLFLCFTSGQLEGMHFGTEDAPGKRPRGAPSPRGRMCLR